MPRIGAPSDQPNESLMMTKPILLDLDGVLADLIGGLRAHCQRRLGDASEFPDEVSEWGITTADQATNTAIWTGFRIRGLFLNLEPIPGSIEAVRELQQHHPVRFCSTPFPANPWCAEEKAAWLRRHFGIRAHESLILTADKTLIVGSVLVDDHPELSGISTPSWERVVFDHPYNQGVQGHRIRRWDEEAVSEILKLAQRHQQHPNS